MRHLILVALFYAFVGLFYSAAHKPVSSRASATALPAGTVTAPDAATIGSGASYKDSVSLSQKGGDLESSHVPRETEQDAQAPAGATIPPVGALKNQPENFNVAAEIKGCPCGENCQCHLIANPQSASQSPQDYTLQPVAYLSTITAPPQPLAPAVPVPAAALGPRTYTTYRPTPYYYAPSACGPGGCGRASFGGLFRRGR